LDTFKERINDVINEDISYVKTPLALRNQRCYAVKVKKKRKKKKKKKGRF